eukprot:CAMPEP_0174744772 /NCGR_PEP_ID=MMETSP1094-20130205/85313_1 /TAXON_ID=156173 /ORGANISM="Chrysochromulina brevifilum, Strain UTEX LB 985" /LENGTH=37 /DNA_ID= /DNA_START= /DNA_END= /DNA_ORIENTATION=
MHMSGTLLVCSALGRWDLGVAVDLEVKPPINPAEMYL